MKVFIVVRYCDHGDTNIANTHGALFKAKTTAFDLNCLWAIIKMGNCYLVTSLFTVTVMWPTVVYILCILLKQTWLVLSEIL